MSKIVDFYANRGGDHKNRTHKMILRFKDKEFEECHDFIQWLFPLHEKSRMTSADVPVLTLEDAKILQGDILAKNNMVYSILRYMKFLGIHLDVFDQEKQPYFISEKIANWCHDGNHNLLRITRMLRSIRFFGDDESAQDLYKIFYKLAIQYNLNVTTIQYWNKATYGNLWESLYNA